MDLITQGIIGAGVAVAVAKPGQIKSAALIGALAGLAPDLDILIRSPENPLLALQYHRHFTHALAFIPIGGSIIAGAYYYLSRIVSKTYTLSFKAIWCYSIVGIATHGLLDACTSYGTRLLWPFLQDRLAWNIISIIDPIFTGLLIIGLVLSLRAYKCLYMRAALLLALLYLGVGYRQHNRVEAFMQTLAAERGHEIKTHMIDTSLGNIILWRSVYQANTMVYVDAVRMPLYGPPTYYSGDSVPAVTVDDIARELNLSDDAYKAVQDFDFFANSFLYYTPDNPTLIGDLRYASLPHKARPLWGLDLSDTLKFTRIISKDGLPFGTLWAMIRGRE